MTAPADLARRTVTGTGWAAVDQVVKQLIQVAVYTALARLLAPADFGLLAMAVVFTAFAALVGQLGLEASVVQSRHLTARELTGMSWLALGANTGIALVLVLLAHPLAQFYGQPRLTRVIVAVSLTFPLEAVGTVPRGLLVRRLDFRRLCVADVLGVAAGAAVTLAAAVFGLGVLSLVVGMLVEATLTSALLLAVARWRPGRGLHLRELRRHARFSGNLLAFNVVNYWARNSDNLLIGRILGATALGYYERCYLLLLYPVGQIAGTLGRVMLPSLSLLRDEPDRVRRAYLRSVGAVAVVTAPLMLGLCALAEPFVLTVFGPAWRPAIPVLRILAAAGALQALSTTVGYLYQCRGRTDLMLRMGVVNSVLMISAIGAGVAAGTITWVAATYGLVSTLGLFYPTVAVPARLVGLRFREFVGAALPSIGCAALMAAAVAAVDAGVLRPASPPVRLLTGVGLGGSVYLAAVFALRVPAALDLVRLLRNQLRRPTPVAEPAVAEAAA